MLRDCGPALAEALPIYSRVGDYLEHWSAIAPDREAAVLAGSDLRLTYAELAARVERLQHALVAAGVGPGDRVAMLSTPRPEYLVVFLAVTGIGATWMGLNPRYSADELRHPLVDAVPKIVFAFPVLGDRDFAPVLASLVADGSIRRLVLMAPSVAPGELLDSFLEGPVDTRRLGKLRAGVTGASRALLVYTSGTTGRPKGAMLTHFGLTHCSRVQALHFGHLGQRALNNLPINHVGCVGDLSVWTLVLGGTLVFMEKFDPAGVVRVLGDERITCWGQVPTMFQLTMAHPDWPQADTSHLRFVTWSGAMAPRPLIEAFRKLPVRLGSAYGMTETVGSVTFADDDDTLDVLAETVGRPDPHYDVRVASVDGSPVPEGEQGEVQVRGEFLMAGYLNRPKETAAAYTSDGWLKTGDAAIRNPDGTIRLVGRLVEMFKSGGYNVYPREVELALEAHPDVELACVVGVPDETFGEIGRAFVVARPGVDVANLLHHCRSRLANYKIPKSLEIVEALPMLPIGKVDRAALKQRVLSGA